MTDIKRDMRKIGGHRSYASFKMSVADPDPFNVRTDIFTGLLIFNVRGGALFIEDAELAQAETRIFRESDVATLNTMDIDIGDGKTCSLQKIKIKLSRSKNIEGEKGIIFKFVQSSEQHIDLLNALVDRLPHVESDTEVIPDQLRKSA